VDLEEEARTQHQVSQGELEGKSDSLEHDAASRHEAMETSTPSVSVDVHVILILRGEKGGQLVIPHPHQNKGT
jgi:hypothetical protein